MFTSAYLLAYFCFLRVGKISITSDASQDRVLQFSAESFATENMLIYIFSIGQGFLFLVTLFSYIK